MQILLQHRKSGLYLRGDGEWTQDINAARDFREIVRAVDYANVARLLDLDILMHFADSRHDVRLSASPEADGVKGKKG
jgi:hypothetical protein